MSSRPSGRLRAVASACSLLGASLALTAAPAGAQDPLSPYAPAPTTAPVPPPAPAACPNADAAPGTVSAAAYGEAVRCLASAERAAAGLGALRTNRSLRIAALRHTTDMVARRYFAHERGRDTPQRRIAATGYTRVRSWRIGEVLAWGTGPLATPRGVVAAWMASPEHHAILMDGRLRDVGVGVVGQVALSGAAGATVTADLGRRG